MPREIIRSIELQADYNNAAVIVPGQASQKVGMGEVLYNQSEAAREVFEEVNDALGFRLSDIMFHGPPGILQNTVNAQPAVYTLALATHATMKEQLGDEMIIPKSVAGHSVGTYATLPITGMLDIGSGAKLVRKRGELMQEASRKPEGSMAAILGHLDEIALERILAETGVELANINTDEQIVLSGEKKALARAMDLATASGAKKVIPLPVSGAFHSRLMKPAQQGLQEYISRRLDLKDPNTPIIANSTARPLTTANEVTYELVNGLCLQVDWTGSVRFMAKQEIKTFIELGSKVLKSMVERIDPNLHAFSVDSYASAQKLAQLIQQPTNRSKPLNA